MGSVVSGSGGKKKRRESWQSSHVEAFFGVAQLQKADHGIRQYGATVKCRSVRIPLIINIPGESLRYSLFCSILIKHMLQCHSTEGTLMTGSGDASFQLCLIGHNLSH